MVSVGFDILKDNRRCDYRREVSLVEHRCSHELNVFKDTSSVAVRVMYIIVPMDMAVPRHHCRCHTDSDDQKLCN